MSRWMAGGLLSALTLALTLAGTAALPAAGQAQVGEFQGEADFDPVSPASGETVTASDSSCFDGTTAIWWSLRAYGEVVPSLTGTVPLAADGSWELTFTAPNEGGEWLFFAVCLPPTASAPDDLVAHIDEIMTEGPDLELMEEWGVEGFLYYAHILEVEGPTLPTSPTTSTPAGPTTTVPAAAPAPAPAPPATPVPGEPTFAG
jgi:hypothetical protein